MHAALLRNVNTFSHPTGAAPSAVSVNEGRPHYLHGGSWALRQQAAS